MVADTGNGRVVTLDSAGRLVTTYRPAAGVFQPYALALAGAGVDVLDAGQGAVLRFNARGRFVGVIAHDPALVTGRGMAVGPDGSLYVANPATNQIVALTADGRLERKLTSPLASGPGQFNQPSDVAVTRSGIIYVLDNINDRIEALNSNGAYLGQWPAPPSGTVQSAHVLPLDDGRLLASDPSGAIIIYSPSGASTRHALTAPGSAPGPVQPLGMALMPGGGILVADATGNRLLIVHAS